MLDWADGMVVCLGASMGQTVVYCSILQWDWDRKLDTLGPAFAASCIEAERRDHAYHQQCIRLQQIERDRAR